MTATDQPTHPPVDVDTLPPTQYLILEVLAARHRTGEQMWTFPSRLSPQMRALAQAGLIGWKSGIVANTVMASLTGAGRAAALSDRYMTPEPVGRERIARYLDRAAANLRRPPVLLGDEVRANAWAEAASWCRDDTIWADSPEEEER